MPNDEFAVTKTTHTTHYTDALAGLQQLSDETIDLTVTSPPYPMIEMWDDIFASCDPQIKTAIKNNNWETAYTKMHDYLSEVPRCQAPRLLASLTELISSDPCNEGRHPQRFQSPQA